MSKAWMITGVSSGLGRSLAEAVLAGGGRVVGTLRKAEQVAAFEKLAPGRAFALPLDITHQAVLPDAVEAAWKRLGGIDVFVNNAGYGVLGCLEELSDAEVESCVDTNFVGTINMVRAVLPFMRERGRGDIINIASVAGLVGVAGMAIYSAVKFGIVGLSDALARELAPLGIRVMVVEPGGFRTEFAKGSIAQSAQRLPAYAGTVGDRSRNAMSNYGGKELGDPDKFADVLLKMVDGPELPAHFVCGGAANSMYRRYLADRLESLDKWSVQGMATDYIDPPLGTSSK